MVPVLVAGSAGNKKVRALTRADRQATEVV